MNGGIESTTPPMNIRRNWRRYGRELLCTWQGRFIIVSLLADVLIGVALVRHFMGGR